MNLKSSYNEGLITGDKTNKKYTTDMANHLLNTNVNIDGPMPSYDNEDSSSKYYNIEKMKTSSHSII